MADDKKARELLEKIRRLPHNKRCANCDKEAPPGSGGHGDICVKFSTFVCHTCKSAHQAFSHRCKSVTMSNWTTHEVLALKDEAGGGNAQARKTWLGQMEGSGAGGLLLRPDDPLDKVKTFVDECYNRKRYWRDPDGGGQSSCSSYGPASTTTTTTTTQHNHSGAASRVRPPTPPPPSPTKQLYSCSAAAASAAGANFLDFAADFSSPAATTPAATTHEDWAPFQAASAPSAPSAPTSTTTSSNSNYSAFGFICSAPASAHDFGDFVAAPKAAAMAPPMQPQLPKPVMLSSARAFDDPFAGLGSNPTHCVFGGPPAPRPVMPVGGMGMGGMGAMQPQPQQPPRPAPGIMMGGPGFVGPMPMQMAPRPLGMGPMGPMGGMGGAPPANGIPGYGFVVPSGPGPRGPPAPPAAGARPMGMGMGMGMGIGTGASPSPASAYKPREPDPFASLDAAWRTK